jgi:hypothetical protein
MISERLTRFLETSREVPGLRAMRTTLRTAHIIAFAALYGGHVYGLPAARLLPALLATVVTGGAFAALECYHAPIWIVQLRGVSTLVKLLLVACVALRWELRILFLTAAIVIGSLASHMPARFRYYSVLHGGQIGKRESG